MAGSILTCNSLSHWREPTFPQEWSNDSFLELLREAASGERLAEQQGDER